jgi:hypothetical protein
LLFIFFFSFLIIKINVNNGLSSLLLGMYFENPIFFSCYCYFCYYIWCNSSFLLFFLVFFVIIIIIFCLLCPVLFFLYKVFCYFEFSCWTLKKNEIKLKKSIILNMNHYINLYIYKMYLSQTSLFFSIFYFSFFLLLLRNKILEYF